MAALMLQFNDTQTKCTKNKSTLSYTQHYPEHDQQSNDFKAIKLYPGSDQPCQINIHVSFWKVDHYPNHLYAKKKEKESR